MTAFFRHLDVDYVQWKAVTRTLLRTDFRLPLTEGASGFGQARSLALMFFIFSLFGLGASVVVFVNPNVLLTGTITLAYLSAMLMTTLLTQHGLTLLSTADYVILGSRPVSSRTFLAIRLTNVLFHALVVTSLTAYPVVFAYAVAHGVSVARGIAALFAIYAWSLMLTLALVAAYGTLVRTLGAARLQSTIGYLQLAAGFMVYGGLFLASRVVHESALHSATLPDAWWIALIPPAWFASYLEAAGGAMNSTTLLRGVLSVVSLVGLSAILRGRLSLDYARHLSEVLVNTDSLGTASMRPPFFTRDERRAAAILVLAHFRHDLRVRLGILAIVPLIVFYLVLGASDEAPDLVAWAVLLFPALLTRQFASSEAYRASWLYHVTPASHAHLIIAAKNIAVIYFLLPFLLLVALVFSWRSNDVAHGFLQAIMLGIISHLALQGAIILAPRLPFSQPPDKTTGSSALMAWMLLVILGGQGAMAVLERWVYPSTARTAAALLALVAASWLLNHAIAWRVGGMQRR
jgi:hypothetical protein